MNRHVSQELDHSAACLQKRDAEKLQDTRQQIIGGRQGLFLRTLRISSRKSKEHGGHVTHLSRPSNSPSAKEPVTLRLGARRLALCARRFLS